jgi:hypothetical protein
VLGLAEGVPLLGLGDVGLDEAHEGAGGGGRGAGVEGDPGEREGHGREALPGGEAKPGDGGGEEEGGEREAVGAPPRDGLDVGRGVPRRGR